MNVPVGVQKAWVFVSFYKERFDVLSAGLDELLYVVRSAPSARAASAAEEELVKRYSYLVKISARPFFLCGWDSEDFIQEGMFGLLKAIRDYDPAKSSSFGAFAELCIRRQLYNAVRHGLSANQGPLTDYVSLDGSADGNHSAAEILADGFDVEADVILRDELDRLLRGVEKALSVLEKQVLALYLAGLSIGEIAGKLSKQPKAVENAIYRIRRKAADVSMVETGSV